MLRALEDVVDFCIAHPFLDEVPARIANRSEQFDRLLRNLCNCEPRFGFRHRGFQAVALAEIEHPRRAPSEQSRRLQLHFHLHEVALDSGQPAGRDAVTDRHVLLFEEIANEIERRAPYPDRHRGNDRPGRVEGRHHVLETTVLPNLGTAEQVIERDPAVVENDRGGVGCADAEFVLDADHFHAGRVVLDHERLDSGAARAFINRRPHHDEALGLLGRHLARGAKNLGAVDRPVIAVARGSRSNGG